MDFVFDQANVQFLLSFSLFVASKKSKEDIRPWHMRNKLF